MRKTHLFGWVTFAVLFLSLNLSLNAVAGDPKQPTANSFCQAEMEARKVLDTYWGALSRARVHLQRIEKEAGTKTFDATKPIRPVAMGLGAKRLPVSKAIDAGERLTAAITEIAKGPIDDGSRTAFKVTHPQDIYTYLHDWNQRARALPQVDPDDVRAPLRFTLGATKKLGVLGGIVLGAVGGAAYATLGEPPMVELPEYITNLLPGVGIGGAVALVAAPLIDVINYFRKKIARADDIGIDIQGTARLETLEQQVSTGRWLAGSTSYFGTVATNGDALDIIYEVELGMPTLTVLRWRPAVTAPVAPE